MNLSSKVESKGKGSRGHFDDGKYFINHNE
jgi:hypothetical protein